PLSLNKRRAPPTLLSPDIKTPPPRRDRSPQGHKETIVRTGPTYSHVAADWHIPAQSPVAPGPPTMPVTPWPGLYRPRSTRHGTVGPPHHPVRPPPRQAQPASPPPGRPPLRNGGRSGSWSTTRSAMPRIPLRAQAERRYKVGDEERCRIGPHD